MIAGSKQQLRDNDSSMLLKKAAQAAKARSTSSIVGTLLVFWILGQADHAQSQVRNANPHLGDSLIAHSPAHFGTEQLIDFSLLDIPATSKQHWSISSLQMHKTTADLTAESTISGQRVGASWLEASAPDVSRPLYPLLPDRHLIPDLGYRAIGGVTGERLQPFPFAPTISRLQAKLGSNFCLCDGWLTLHVNQVSWFSAAHSVSNLHILSASMAWHVVGLRTVEGTGQVDLLAFDLGLADEWQAMRIDRGWPMRVSDVRLMEAGNQATRQLVNLPFGPISAANWRHGLGTGVDTSFDRTPRPRPVAFVALRERPPLIRPALLRRPAGRRDIARLAMKTEPARPTDERSIVLQSPKVADRSLRDHDGHLGVQAGFDRIGVAQPIGLGGSDVDQDDHEVALVMDNGWLLASSFTVPVGRLSLSGLAEDRDGGVISLIPFIDTGTIWNSETTNLHTTDPWSIGAGIGWQITGQIDLRFGVDIPIVDTDSAESDDPRDLGVQFRLSTALGD